jgi:hypothetical protein
MNRLFKLALVGGILSAGAAWGDDAPSKSTSDPAAISPTRVESKTSAAPVEGRNSFTAEQVRRRLEAHGYSQVRDLQLDHRGVWNGSAVRNGSEVGVSVDYQGNITWE